MASSAVICAVLTTVLTLPSAFSVAGLPLGVQRGSKAPKDRLETYAGSLTDAQTSAFDRNVPLIVIAILEDEADDVTAFRENVLSDKTLAKSSKLAVVLLTNNGLHPTTTIRETVDGAEVEREVCAVYKTGSCSAHQKVFDEVYNAFHVDGELILPFVSILTPDRKVHETFADGSAPSLGSVASSYNDARRKAGEGLTIQGLAEVRAHLTRGEQQIASRSWGDAWRTYARVLVVTTKTRYADKARAQQTQALGGLEAVRDGALAKLEAGEVAAGYGELVTVNATAAETPLEEELSKLIKTVERDKRFKDEIAGLKKEYEATALLEEAERLFRASDDKKATAKVRQIFRKYAGTKAATLAAERWPDLVPKK
jgi:hypothetical protein